MFTPESEEIHNEKEAFVCETKNLVQKLLNRVQENRGNWSVSHRNECNDLILSLNRFILEVEEL